LGGAQESAYLVREIKVDVQRNATGAHRAKVDKYSYGSTIPTKTWSSQPFLFCLFVLWPYTSSRFFLPSSHMASIGSDEIIFSESGCVCKLFSIINSGMPVSAPYLLFRHASPTNGHIENM
jgi:hypothetical protein